MDQHTKKCVAVRENIIQIGLTLCAPAAVYTNPINPTFVVELEIQMDVVRTGQQQSGVQVKKYNTRE